MSQLRVDGAGDRAMLPSPVGHFCAARTVDAGVVGPGGGILGFMCGA